MTQDVFTTPEERAHDQEWTEDFLNVESYLEKLRSRARAQATAAADADSRQLAEFWEARALRIDAAVQELNLGNA